MSCRRRALSISTIEIALNKGRLFLGIEETRITRVSLNSQIRYPPNYIDDSNDSISLPCSPSRLNKKLTPTLPRA